jgi:hypothetical protein
MQKLAGIGKLCHIFNVIGKKLAAYELSNNKTIENYSGKKKNELNSQLRPIKK